MRIGGRALSGRFLSDGLGSTIATSYAIQVLNVATGVLLARGLTPVDRGVVAAVVLWPPLLATFFSMGLNETLTVFVSTHRRENRPILAAGCVIAAVGGGAAAAFGGLILPHLLPEIPRPLLVVYSAYPLFGLATTVAVQALLGLGHLKRYNRARLLVQVATTILLVVTLTTVGLTPMRVVIAYLVAELITLVYAWASQILRLSFRTTVGDIGNLLSYGSKIQLGVIANAVNERGIQLLLASLVAARDFGIYVVALAFAAPTVIIGASVAPLVLAQGRGGRGANSGGDAIRWDRALVTVVVSMAAATLSAAAIPTVLPLVVGVSYLSAVPVAQWLCFIAVLLGVNRVLSAGLQGRRAPLQASAAQFAGAILTLLTGVLMIEHRGLTGAVVAASVGAAATTLLLLLATIGLDHRDARQRNSEFARLSQSSVTVK